MTAKPQTAPDSAASRSQLLRINDVVALTTLSKSCVTLWVAQGRFPRPVAPSSTLKVWKYSDLVDWIDKQFKTADGVDRMPTSTGSISSAKARGESV